MDKSNGVHCLGCRWHEGDTSAGLHYCRHSRAVKLTGGRVTARGRLIGRTDLTPAWCPVPRRPPESEG